jgi:hypothetical protein
MIEVWQRIRSHGTLPMKLRSAKRVRDVVAMQ